MTLIRPATDDDVDQILALGSQAFNTPPSSHERIRKELKLDTVRVAEIDGRVRATARFIPAGHFYGGRSIKAAGIAGVAVAAEVRGKGLGTALMRSVLAELRDDGFLISSLYPATSPIYKYLGYGFGAIRTEWKVRLSELPGRAPEADIEEFGLDGLPEIAHAYARFAETQNGLLDRPHDWWERRVFVDREGRDYYRYLVREAGKVTGWIIYRLRETKDHWRSTVSCRDLIWTTPTACGALLGLAALHRSTCEYLTWVGPSSEPLADLLPEDVIQSDGSFRTMVRLLDLPAAIEARGYNRTVSAAATIRIDDPSFEQNAGPWRIEVADGRAKCIGADEAEASTDARTWAQIWSGLTHPADALRTGSLSATPEAVEALGAIFAGPTPWLGDFY